MLTIKIFLASSITEFASQRKELEAFITSLNNIYVERGIYFKLIVCEDLSNAVRLERSQDMYNREIRDSQYFYVIFGRKAGKYTIEEFDVALSSFREKGEPRVYTYFMVLPEGEQPDRSVLEVKRRIRNELDHYHNSYKYIDSIKLNLLMELVKDRRVGGTLTLEGGLAHLDGAAIMSMANIPLYSKNGPLQELQEEQRALEREFVLLARLGDSEDAQRMRLKNSMRRNEIAARLHAMEKEMLALCGRVEESRRLGEKLNWREAKALELADNGDYEAAKALLRDEQWQQEVSRAEEKITEAKEVIREYISGKKALIRMIRSSGVTKLNEPEIISIYEDICGLAVKHLAEISVLLDYASFLQFQNKHTRALEIAETFREMTARAETTPLQQADCYNRLGYLYCAVSRFSEAESALLKAKDIREKLAAENPAYLPELANSCNNLGNLYFGMSRYEEAETEYLRAKEIWEKLAAGNPEAHLPALAAICNNLGILYGETRRYKEAEALYLRSKEIREKLAAKDPGTYLPDLANTCNNLGNLYSDISGYKEAEAEYLRAKEIREKLAAENPAAYLLKLAECCYNLGTLYYDTSRDKEAEAEYLRAKEIWFRYAEKEPSAFLRDCIRVCRILARLYSSMDRTEEADQEYALAEKCQEQLEERTGQGE